MFTLHAPFSSKQEELLREFEGRRQKAQAGKVKGCQKKSARPWALTKFFSARLRAGLSRFFVRVERPARAKIRSRLRLCRADSDRFSRISVRQAGTDGRQKGPDARMDKITLAPAAPVVCRRANIVLMTVPATGQGRKQLGRAEAGKQPAEGSGCTEGCAFAEGCRLYFYICESVFQNFLLSSGITDCLCAQSSTTISAMQVIYFTTDKNC